MQALLKRGFLLASYSNITLKFSKEQNAAFLTLTNSKKRNPLSLQTIQQMQAALQQVANAVPTHNLKILVLKAQGPVFSSGHDLKELKASQTPETIFQACTQNILLLKKLPIVTVSAINGIAAAAGLQTALSCDLVLATENSSFSTPGVKWGLFCSTPGVALIRSITSEKKAREMLLFGEAISAKEALQYGLINKVVAGEKELNDEVNGYIEKLSHLSGQVIALGKQVLARQEKEGLEQAYCTAATGMKDNILTKEDCKQGLSAFSQKRHPHFKH